MSNRIKYLCFIHIYLMIIFLSAGCGSSGSNGKKPLNTPNPISYNQGVMVLARGADIFFFDSNGDYSAYLNLNNYGFSSEKGDSLYYKGFRGEKGIFAGICNHSDTSRERILYFDTRGNFQNVSINPHEYIQSSICGALVGTVEGYLILFGDSDFSEFKRVNKFFLFDETGNLIDVGNEWPTGLMFINYTFDRGQLYSGERYELIRGDIGMTTDPSYGVNPCVLPDRSTLLLGFSESGKIGITHFDINGQFVNGVTLSDLLNGTFGFFGGGIDPILDGKFAVSGSLNGTSVILLFNKDALLEKTIDLSAFTDGSFSLGTDLTSNGSSAIMLSGPESPILKSVTTISSTSIKMEWEDKSQGEDGFGIERAVGPTLNMRDFKLVATIGTGETSYLDADLSPNTTFWYRVFPFRSKYKLGYSNISSIKTPQ